jgi:hypothetical protein
VRPSRFAQAKGRLRRMAQLSRPSLRAKFDKSPIPSQRSFSGRLSTSQTMPRYWCDRTYQQCANRSSSSFGRCSSCCARTISRTTTLRSAFNTPLSFYDGRHCNLHMPGTVAEGLARALAPPGYHKEWHIGVRVASNKKLVAFISGVPITLKVREKWVSERHVPLNITDARSAVSLRAARSTISAYTRNYARSVSLRCSSRRSRDSATSRAFSKQYTPLASSCQRL